MPAAGRRRGLEARYETRGLLRADRSALSRRTPGVNKDNAPLPGAKPLIERFERRNHFRPIAAERQCKFSVISNYAFLHMSSRLYAFVHIT